MPELLVVVGIAIVVVGPKKIPDLAKSLGKGFAEFKKATQEIKDQLEIDDAIHDIKDTMNEVKEDIINVSSQENNHTRPKTENNTKDETATEVNNRKTAEDQGDNH
jgi:sec-independent protein translocase protein TatB